MSEQEQSDPIESLPQMHLEWRAWRGVCLELERVRININQADPLARALRRWGEELVALRGRQPRVAVAQALEQYRREYPKLPES